MNRVMALGVTGGKDVVHVYKHGRGFVCSFGERVLKDATNITACNDNRVTIVDIDDSRVDIFTEEGQQLSKFNIT